MEPALQQQQQQRPPQDPFWYIRCQLCDRKFDIMTLSPEWQGDDDEYCDACALRIEVAEE